MNKRPKYGELYYYIDNDGLIGSKRNTVQDTDIQNYMNGNYYHSYEKAKIARNMMARRKEKQSG